MFGILNPWQWLAIALVAAGLFGAGYANKAISAAEERGELKTELATATATLDGLKAQQKDLKEQVAKSELAAARIPLVVTQWHKDTNATPIGSKCEEGDAFLYARVPIIVSHRKMETFQ